MDKSSSIKEFICKRHPSQLIRKISYCFGSVQLYCVDCVIDLDKAVKKNLHNIEDLVELALKDQNNDKEKELKAKTNELPDGVGEVLAREQEIKFNLAQHIQQEKVKTNQAFENLRQNVINSLDKKRIETLKALDDQLVMLHLNFKLFVDKVEECRSGAKTKMTAKSLISNINLLENTEELEKFLTLLKSDIDEKKSYIGMNSEEIVKSIHAGLVNMSHALSDLSNTKPTCILADSLQFEEILLEWDKSISSALTDLKTRIKDSIPKLSLATTNIDSLIIKEKKYITLIQKWLAEAEANATEFELIYRGSRDGFGSSQSEFEVPYFHQKCDNKGPTLVVVQATTGERFGGYSPFNWISDGAGPYFSTTKSFLFSLDSEEKLKVKDQTYAVYSKATWGPCWGGVSDLAIANQCDISGSYSDTGNAYEKLQGRKYFTNDRAFVVEEMEVFALQSQSD